MGLVAIVSARGLPLKPILASFAHDGMSPNRIMVNSRWPSCSRTTATDWDGGTFTLSFGGQTTGNIAYNASAATVQTALEGLSSIGSGNIAVTKTQNTGTAQEWTLTFQGTLAQTNVAQVTINSTNVMAFGKSDIQSTTTAGGSGSNNEVQVITLSNATDGTFRLAFGGQTTAPLAYNASASTVQTALRGLSTIGGSNVAVSGSNGGPWTVTFQNSLANTNVAVIQADAATGVPAMVVPAWLMNCEAGRVALELKGNRPSMFCQKT